MLDILANRMDPSLRANQSGVRKNYKCSLYSARYRHSGLVPLAQGPLFKTSTNGVLHRVHEISSIDRNVSPSHNEVGNIAGAEGSRFGQAGSIYDVEQTGHEAVTIAVLLEAIIFVLPWPRSGGA